MPLVRTRETTISPCVGLAPSLTCVLEKKEQLLYSRVYSKKKEQLQYTAVLL